jgi:L-asparaginase
MSQSGKPTVAIFTLGGTIAMLQTPDGGVAPALSASELLAAVPGLDRVDVRLQVHDFLNKPGASLTLDDIVSVVDAIRAALTGGCVGAVVTQGTDTIEETSYLLDLLVPSDAPVIVTGAMRNPTMASPDGPANILASIRVAASDSARGQGCLVVMNDQIHAARWVQKTHSTSPAAFASPNHGPIGHVVEDRVDIPVQIRRRFASIRPSSSRRVRVGLMTMTLGEDGALLDVLGEHVDGLVVAGFGVGHVPAGTVAALARLAGRMPVVLASRTGAGPVHHQTYGFPGSEKDLLARGLISAGYVSPVKARLLLHLLIASGANTTRIKAAFTVAGGVAQPEPRAGS